MIVKQACFTRPGRCWAHHRDFPYLDIHDDIQGYISFTCNFTSGLYSLV